VEGSQYSPSSRCTNPSPQNPSSTTHWSLHPSKLRLFPSSHCSALSMMPSPHRAFVQSVLHVASATLEFPGPSSHSSPSSTFPSPHRRNVNRQSSLQPYGSVGSCKAGSHCSPDRACTMPSPQNSPPAIRIGSSVQVGEHPSPGKIFPSSHCSELWRIPSPQRAVLQRLLH